MITEEGRVVAVKSGEIWVETVGQTVCGKCSAQTGCGQGLLTKMVQSKKHHLICLQSDKPAAVGDTLVMGIQEHTLLNSSFLTYGVPVLALVMAAVIADGLLGLTEGAVIFAAFSGLLLGFIGVKLHGVLTGHKGFQPIVLDVIPRKRVSIVEQASPGLS